MIEIDGLTKRYGNKTAVAWPASSELGILLDARSVHPGPVGPRQPAGAGPDGGHRPPPGRCGDRAGRAGRGRGRAGGRFLPGHGPAAAGCGRPGRDGRAGQRGPGGALDLGAVREHAPGVSSPSCATGPSDSSVERDQASALAAAGGSGPGSPARSSARSWPLHGVTVIADLSDGGLAGAGYELRRWRGSARRPRAIEYHAGAR